MDDSENRVAALANISTYHEEATKKYINGAPHIKHASIRGLYSKLLVQVLDYSKTFTDIPKVLDLGAGEGSTTLPFLEFGAHVTAVDSSKSQLEELQNRCRRFSEGLTIRCEDVSETLEIKGEKYDIIVANSFIHHVPDYIGLINKAIYLLSPNGQFFSFQDPQRYDSLPGFTNLFSKFAYFSFRIFQGDLIEGIRRRIRRCRGIFLENSMYDNAEYHVVRNGVDQDAISRIFDENGFDCEVVSYFSTQSTLFQHLGTFCGVKNTFAVLARKNNSTVQDHGH
ncbi:MAG: class I SAM-dependent methyltransferase [Anaerolineaceae bacterium]